MELKNFTLKVGKKLLFQKVSISFYEGAVNHILGSNGAGKSSFAKACVGMLKSEGAIVGNEKTILIGSSSNVPEEFYIGDIVEILKNKFEKSRVDELFELLKLGSIPDRISIKKMSDGQKQKIKLFAFLCDEPKVIILDEFTNALDKNSSIDLYEFIRRYIERYPITIINITHNLSDLEYMEGKYFYISQMNIDEIESKQKITQMYIQGE